MKIAIVNGPNLGRLGRREPSVYGTTSWGDFQERLDGEFGDIGLFYFQSNHEGAAIDFLESLEEDGVNGLVINAGAWTHQSYALRDALSALAIPVVEVHISNIYKRERFRATSLLAPVVQGQISGLGLKGYALAIEFLRDVLREEK